MRNAKLRNHLNICTPRLRNSGIRQEKVEKIVDFLGPIYVVSGTRDNPPYRGNFIERLYEKKLCLLAETKLTLLKYS